MLVDGRPYRTIWRNPAGPQVEIIDQTRLPHDFATLLLHDVAEVARAIRDMNVRGAPLIGVAAAYGVALAMRDDPSDDGLAAACVLLSATRPTAVNLAWALIEMRRALRNVPPAERCAAAFSRADALAEEDVATCAAMGRHGLDLIRAAAARKQGSPVNILTHCNAGWLAAVDWGTATAPIYTAWEAGVALHVFVDETRPRNQGAALTAWELGRHGVPHTVIADNAGGHLMQHGRVDLAIVGADRVTSNGDVANKIGTYLKALAAHDNGVPFHVAVPSSTIDWNLRDGISNIPIEERDGNEVAIMTGKTASGAIASIRIIPDSSQAANPAFDVTPSRLVTGLITERGLCPATESGLRSLFPEAA
jgi:methylthioribose-1-phosphate isomerase